MLRFYIGFYSPLNMKMKAAHTKMNPLTLILFVRGIALQIYHDSVFGLT